MIIGIISPKGQGKTVSMVKMMLEGLTKGNRIMANMKNLTFDYELLGDDFFKNFSKYSFDEGALICIDEIHIFVDSRNSSSTRNKLMSYLFTQTSKRNIRLLYTTQFYHQIDKRLRDNTEIFIRCKKVIVIDQETAQEKVYIHLNIYNNITNKVTGMSYLANPIFPFYKRSEIINWDNE